jgi:hypothetical protein
MLTTAITWSLFTYITCSFFFCNSIHMKISSQPPILHYIHMCVCISFWLISFYLWLILIFLFSRVSYEFTPLQHYMSRQLNANLKHVKIILTRCWYSIYFGLEFSLKFSGKQWFFFQFYHVLEVTIIR